MKLSTGKYIKASEVRHGEVVKVLDEGEFVKSKFMDENGNPKMSFQIKVEDDAKNERVLTLNRTNQTVLIEEWGSETSEWIGKAMRLNLTKVNVGGSIKDGILVSPIDEPIGE